MLLNSLDAIYSGKSKWDESDDKVLNVEDFIPTFRLVQPSSGRTTWRLARKRWGSTFKVRAKAGRAQTNNRSEGARTHLQYIQL